jgi:hypothetical protein
MRQNPEQLEINLEPSAPAALPPIVSLREFVEQVEKEYGPEIPLQAVRAALEDREA